MPLSPERTESVKTTHSQFIRSPPDGRQPCRECRRRKGKCDGTIPVCSVCQRYKRHCLYDKHSRTSLTRKHLTEVEERLERAEALLRTVFTGAEVSQMLDSRPANVLPPIIDSPLSSSTQHGHVASPPESFLPNTLASNPSSSQGYWTEASSNSGIEPSKGAGVGDLDSLSVSTPITPEAAPQPFESLPSADDDFEWDERESSWSFSGPRGDTSLFESVEGDIPKITDGMATLTADESNSGYLGTVSGAALLRLIWMSPSDEVGSKSNARNERRKSLEQFFSRRSADDPSSSQWLRTQPLLTRAVVDTLIDAYFGLYHPTFPILHEPTFREQYSKLNGRPNILANIVVALGSFVSSTCSDDTDTTVFAAVKGHLSIDSLETGNLALVQAFALSANYLQKRNKPNSGYNYGGVALRLAIGLGLHKEFHGWKTTPLKKEVRRRVWWSLCILDVGATVTYGRPLNWPQVGVETELPLNVHERDLTSDLLSLPQEVEEPTIYTYVRTQSAYHLRTMRIYNRLISTPFPPAEELVSLDDELIKGWLRSLPQYFRDDDFLLGPEYSLTHSISRWRFRNLRIIMYRPFLIRWALSLGTSQQQDFSSAENLATNRCFEAAKESITLIMDFWASCTHTRLAAWYVLYFLFQASLIPVHCLRRHPLHPSAPDWRTQVRATLDVVDAMKDINPSSSKCHDVIDRLCGSSLLSDERIPPESVESATNWMAEIDTAIDGYDIYCDRLSEAGAGKADWAAIGVQNWDWGLIL